jgi:hypothetical protein
VVTNLGIPQCTRISNIYIKLNTRVYAKLLPNYVPFVHIARLQLLEKPDVDFETSLGAFNLYSTDILKAPGSLIIKKLIISAVEHVLLYPRYFEIDLLQTLNIPPPPEETEEEQRSRGVFSELGGAFSDAGDLALDAVKGVGKGVMKVGELGVDGAEAVGKGVLKVGELGVDGVAAVGKGVFKVGEGAADLGIGAVKGVGNFVASPFGKKK